MQRAGEEGEDEDGGDRRRGRRGRAPPSRRPARRSDGGAPPASPSSRRPGRGPRAPSPPTDPPRSPAYYRCVSPASPYGPKADPGPPGFGPKLLGFCEELRGEGVAVGTSEILDAFAALEHVPWTSQADFREALATTIAKSQDDRRVFELIFDRYFFRAAEASAIEQGIGERPADDEINQGAQPAGDDGERLDSEELARTDPRRDGSRRRERAARPGAAGDRRLRPRGGLRRGRRRRAADPPLARAQRRRPAADRERRGAAADRPRPADRLRAPPAARTGTRPDRADRDAARLAPAGRARPRPPHQPDPGPRRRPPRRLADEAPAGDARPRAARA